jgi:hypothetical protein
MASVVFFWRCNRRSAAERERERGDAYVSIWRSAFCHDRMQVPPSLAFSHEIKSWRECAHGEYGIVLLCHFKFCFCKSNKRMIINTHATWKVVLSRAHSYLNSRSRASAKMEEV